MLPEFSRGVAGASLPVSPFVEPRGLEPRNLLLAKELRYQLRHSPKRCCCVAVLRGMVSAHPDTFWTFLVRSGVRAPNGSPQTLGFEPRPPLDWPVSRRGALPVVLHLLAVRRLSHPRPLPVGGGHVGCAVDRCTNHRGVLRR